MAAALLVRLGTVWLLHTAHAAPVTFEHGEIAANLVRGHGFTVNFLGSEGPTSQQAPIYPLLLAGLYRLFGIESPAAIVGMQLLQCAVGTSLVVAVVLLTRCLIPGRPAAAWIAGGVAAIYPAHVYAVMHIQVCLWVASLLVWLTVLVAHERSKPPHPLRPWLIGFVAGLLLLFEPIMLLALVILAMWLVIPRREETKRTTAAPWTSAAIAVVVSAAVVGPWLVRNWRVHGELVFVKSTFGYALWQGNNPLSWGTDKVPKPSAYRLRRQHDGTLAGMHHAMWEARRETIYIDDLLLKPTGYRSLIGLSEPARGRRLGRRAAHYIIRHPAHYLGLCLRRLRYFLLWDETNPKASHPLYRISTAIWAAAAIAGLLMLVHKPHALGPTVAIFAAVMIFHAATITSARFRIPVEPLTFPWIGYAVASWSERTARFVSGGPRESLQGIAGDVV